MKLLVGSGNKKKLEELRRRIDAASLRIELVVPADCDPPPPSPEEPHQTFLENATEKALRYAEWTGLPVLADDSGLEVDALDGLPGVDSAYFAARPTDDAANNRKLLAELAHVPDDRRTARYRSVLVLVARGRVIFTADGACEGRIGRAPRGDGGFGYDPLFLMPDGLRTFAELAPDEKDRVSHRGKALAILAKALPGLMPELEAR